MSGELAIILAAVLLTAAVAAAVPFLHGLTGTEGVAVFAADGRLLAQDPSDAFATMIVVSRLTRASVPPDVAQIFARMHVPERPLTPSPTGSPCRPRKQ